MRNEFCVHYFVLIVCTTCKLIHRLAWTILHKKLGQILNDLMSFESHLRLVTCYQIQKNLLEVWMRYEVSEDVNVAFSHKC